MLWNRRENHTSGSLLVIFVSGFAGSGKTTIGRLLAEKLKCAYLDKDTVTREFTEYILKANGSSVGDRESSLYTENILPMEYDTLMRLVEENVHIGNSVVISAPFIRQISDSKWTSNTKQQLQAKVRKQCKVKFIWVSSDRDIERIRLIERGASRDEWKLSNWDSYIDAMQRVEPEKNLPEFYYFNNEANDHVSFDEQIEDVLKWLEK